MVNSAGLPVEIAETVYADLDGLLKQIRGAERIGHCQAVRVCCCIAATRLRFYPNDATGWLARMEKEFGYDRRFSYQCLKVGTFVMETLLGVPLLADGQERRAGGYALKPATASTLLRCDLRKLERIAAIPPEHLTRFVELHPDIADIARDPAFEAVTKFVGRLPQASQTDKRAAEALERAEQRAAERKQPEWKLDNWAHEVVKLGAKVEGKFGAVDAKHAFTASFVLQKAAAEALERGDSPLAEEELGAVEQNLVTVLEFVRKMRGAK